MTWGFWFPAVLLQIENWNQKSQVTEQGYICTYSDEYQMVHFVVFLQFLLYYYYYCKQNRKKFCIIDGYFCCLSVAEHNWCVFVQSCINII